MTSQIMMALLDDVAKGTVGGIMSRQSKAYSYVHQVDRNLVRHTATAGREFCSEHVCNMLSLVGSRCCAGEHFSRRFIHKLIRNRDTS